MRQSTKGSTATRRRLRPLWIAAGLMQALGGCAMLDLQGDLQAYPASTALPGSAARASGIRAGWDDKALSANDARQGYWQPGRFLREVGSAVYFLEPYDPERIPVLFVHGAAGSAQDGRYFLERIDRRRFQPWVYVYASGAPLAVSAGILASQLEELRARHGYRALCITAHSMGGLVVRKLLLAQHPGEASPAALFVSLATPWGGDLAAGVGAHFAPVAVPSWNDLDPAGRFLAGLYAQPLPAGVRHHLYFGYRRGTSASRASGDGVIALTSQLTTPAQNEARQVVGFDEDHDSILRSPDVLRRYNALLDEWARSLERPAEEAHAAPGRLPVTRQSLPAS